MSDLDAMSIADQFLKSRNLQVKECLGAVRLSDLLPHESRPGVEQLWIVRYVRVLPARLAGMSPGLVVVEVDVRTGEAQLCDSL